MTYTGPTLTRPQIDALRSIDRRCDTMEVHPAREQALVDRGLIKRSPNHPHSTIAWLTADGAEVLNSLGRGSDQ